MTSSEFAAGQDAWISRLSGLRNIVRQELVFRQLRAELSEQHGPVLDIGCGQGTQALALAERGFHVTGLDSSPELLDRFRQACAGRPSQIRDRIQIIHADITAARPIIDHNRYDVVLCHGVLMYFPDPGPVLDLLTHAVPAGGLLSLLVRNAEALAMRSGLQGDWPTTNAAFNASTYRNRHGVQARADRLDDLRDQLAERGMTVDNWYGVRTFTDALPSDAAVPDEKVLTELLAAEERAGRTDPYRCVSGLLHIIARRH
ncbi:MAG TPA: methyltransferase domain-containing protein [Mycobacteriales bacterium]|nr:methyltransferase domain-containing protein [Mycobacteriales bacterium]